MLLLRIGRHPAQTTPTLSAEVMKAILNKSTARLFSLFKKALVEEERPADWKEGFIVKLPPKGQICEIARSPEESRRS